ncbi:MAG: hypothetical protein JNG90_05850 [Planctomycetaceae bacterium]|nr:hypothetical protein [Planctomycetaceae bacterium]
MATRRYAIALSKSEDASLRQLYVLFRIPDGQYKKRPEDLELFVTTWNYSSGRNDSSDDLLHYIETQRKQKRKNWPRFEGTHRRCASACGLLSIEEDSLLRQIWKDEMIPLGIGTDSAAHDPALVATLEEKFCAAVGRIIPGMVLMAYIEAHRKRGNWLAQKRDGFGAIGFEDIDQVASYRRKAR